MTTTATTTGKVRAVCDTCGKRSAAVAPNPNGEPGLAKLAIGWSVAPYPRGYVHADGSTGSRYVCPVCAARRLRHA